MERTISVKKMIAHNEKTGESSFIGSDDKLYCGQMQFLPAKCPVLVRFNTETPGQSIQFTSINCKGYNKTSSADFLSSNYFSNVGPVTAETFVNKYGIDVFNVDISDVAEGERYIVQKLKHLKDYEPVEEYALKRGGTFLQARLSYLEYGQRTLDEIKKNPYSLFKYDGMNEYDLCERIAHEVGFKSYDKRRLKTLIGLALRMNRNNGNTRITFDEFAALVHKIERRTELYYTEPLFIMETLITMKAAFEKDNKHCYLYAKQDFVDENRISNSIKRLRTSQTAIKDELLSILELEKKYDIIYSEDQKAAFRALKTSGVKIITGGPGTGKTTVLNGLLEKYQFNNPGSEIVLCAPTGCAAKRMRETTGRPAITIHKLLALKPYEKKTESATKNLTADCVIVDEVSMVDASLMAKLLSSVKNGALVILLGDPDQLPSVSAGNVLHDFIDSGIIDIYRLNVVFRQLDHNSIIANSTRVIQGQTALKSDANFRIYRVSDEDSLIDAALRVTNRIARINTFTPVRKVKFGAGTINLNHAIQKQKARKGACVEYGTYRFYVGDKVMFIRNNYSMNYYNGEEGIITGIDSNLGYSKVTIQTEDDTITISGELLNDIELCYVITAHKSQGSECDNALILIPKSPKSMLKRQLLYVEITRAKKNVIIISEGNALEECITNKADYYRQTGLTEKLKKIA